MAKRSEDKDTVESAEEVEEHNIARQILKDDKASNDETIDKNLNETDLERAYSSIHLILGDAGKGHPEYGVPVGIPKFSRLLLLFTRKNVSQENVDRFIPLYRSFLCRKIARDPATLQIDVQSFLDPFNPWNYDEVYKATRQVLQSEIPESVPRDQIYFNLTPGTVTQEITLALIGKEQRGVQFIQVDKNRRHVEVCNLPWDLNLIRKADSESIAKSLPPETDTIFPDTDEGNLARQRFATIAAVDVDCLLLGETGVGKNWIAETVLRSQSSRAGKPFVQFNCAVLGGDLNMMRSLLFGEKKGAHSTSKEDKLGFVRKADGGILFLDEVENLRPDAQAVLLDFIQPREKSPATVRTFIPVGGKQEETTDVRIISATNRDLWSMVQAGQFREDLYWRLAPLTFRIPSLQERNKGAAPNGSVSVIARLARRFVDKLAESLHRRVRLSEEAIQRLEQCDWPGNVRQLQNVIRRALVFAPRNGVIDEAVIRRELENGERFTDQSGGTTTSTIPGGDPDKTTLENGRGAEPDQDIRHIPDDQLRAAMDAELRVVRARYAKEAKTRHAGTQIVAAKLLKVTRQTIKKWSES